MDSSSSSSTKTKTKLYVKNQTRFKKSSFSSTIPASKKMTKFSLREQTMLNKAYELSTLCDIQLCVLYYGRDGELIKTWPEDQSKVRDMAEGFSKLNEDNVVGAFNLVYCFDLVGVERRNMIKYDP